MMRALGAALILAGLALMSLGCGSTTDPGGDEMYAVLLEAPTEVIIGYGQEVAVSGTALRVAFGQLLSDSRCPVDVVCVWEGNAEVEIGVRVGMGPTIPLRMNTGRDPQFADWQGVRFTLLELDPSPRSDTTLRPEDYSVRLKLESLR